MPRVTVCCVVRLQIRLQTSLPRPNQTSTKSGHMCSIEPRRAVNPMKVVGHARLTWRSPGVLETPRLTEPNYLTNTAGHLRCSSGGPAKRLDNVCSTMRTARPTTGSPFSFSEAGTAPFDPASSCFCLFGRLDPANPFIARQRRNVLPRLQRFYVGGQCLFQVRGQVMDHAA